MKKSRPLNRNILVAVLGGGAGTRLFPLTKDRSKPAVPLGGKYRLIDIPISNCINAGLRRIYVLTQFNSASLHRHISQSYRFDHFNEGFVEIMAAQQTTEDSSWYQGTADAIRKNLSHLADHDFEHLLILSGDQLYRMDYEDLILQHQDTGADVTLATIPVRRQDVAGFGILELDAEMRIVRFAEKPKEAAEQDSLKIDAEGMSRLKVQGEGEFFLASMGIYVFRRQALMKLLDNDLTDFGKHVIPLAIRSAHVRPYVFQGYWEDVGTIRSFFEANLELAKPEPRFNFLDSAAPIFSRTRSLPPSKMEDVRVARSIVADGCLLDRCEISDSVVGIRSVIGAGSRLHRTVMLGSDYFESASFRRGESAPGQPPIGIGRNVRIENAIIDKNARIGDDVVISPEGKPADVDHELYFIRDGIVIVPKNQAIPAGTVI